MQVLSPKKFRFFKKIGVAKEIFARFLACIGKKYYLC